jgi:hypothetical protein
MRPEERCLDRKSFSLQFIDGAAELFTFGGGALGGTLPAE